MQAEDHKNLGFFLVRNHLSQITKWEQKLFLTGCVLPDRLPFTYLKGSMHHQKFRGHNYRNSLDMVQKYIGRLNSGSLLAASFYLKLGILMHYAADAYTFPHNEQFQGDLRQHIRYEEDLHEKIDREGCFQGYDFCRESRKSTAEIIDHFIGLHQNYIDTWSSPQDDLIYMRHVTQELICTLRLPQPMAYAEKQGGGSENTGQFGKLMNGISGIRARICLSVLIKTGIKVSTECTGNVRSRAVADHQNGSGICMYGLDTGIKEKRRRFFILNLIRDEMPVEQTADPGIGKSV